MEQFSTSHPHSSEKGVEKVATPCLIFFRAGHTTCAGSCTGSRNRRIACVRGVLCTCHNYDMRGLLHWEPESTNRLRQRRPLHMSHGSRGKRSGTRGQGWPLTGTRKTQDPHNGLDVWGVSVWSLWGPEVSCAGHTTGTGQGRFLTENSPKPLDRLINKGQKGMLVQSAALQNGGNR